MTDTQKAPPEGKAPRTEMYKSVNLYTLVRSDNGAETGLSRTITIGRDATSDIPLPKDNSASQNHAKIEMFKGKPVLTDLGSSNGTWVNGVRIKAPTYINHGDKIRIGDTMFRLQEGEKPLAPIVKPARTRSCLLAGCGSILAGGVVLAIILGAIGIYPLVFPQKEPPTATLQPTANPGLAETQQAMGEGTALRALVLVKVLISGGWYGGSGSLLDSRGYILTNFHVIGDPDTGELHEDSEKITVGINWDNPVDEPSTYYLCEIVKADKDYDLALLHVIALKNGDPLPPDLTFPTLPIGNSDELKIGDPITVIGFPALGGMTPTLTRGTVSGFISDPHIQQDRGWIKTDTEVNHGNSGGMAINVKGELIGVPTQALMENDTEGVGKISRIRPINLTHIVIDSIP
jgi:pSer/pThr/pTyr-binding forkhead associated (FHA) protein/V8-like Glu-specific endopeptidase